MLPILIATPVSWLRAPLLVRIPAALGRWRARPALLHWRRARIDLDSLGSSAAPDAAAKNCQEKETANASGNPNDKIFVVVDPRTDFFACRRTFTLALETAHVSQNQLQSP